jgi:hypothetical protein
LKRIKSIIKTIINHEVHHRGNAQLENKIIDIKINKSKVEKYNTFQT